MILDVYCDESRQELATTEPRPQPGQYLLLGGLWLEAAHRESIKAAIGRLRIEHDVHGEFKWNRVSPSRLPFYLALIDLFFREESRLRFRCLVLPANLLDAVAFHRGDPELMFYKFYYQLLHPWILEGNEYRFFVDMKTNRVRSRVQKLQEVLVNANALAVVRSVQALPSHEVDLIQLVDVLIGAVGFQFMPGSSRAKRAVIQRIEQGLGRRIGPTSRAASKFNVFSWRPQEDW